MKLVLCIGSGNLDADKKAKFFALKSHVTYHGLLESSTIVGTTGCYHTSINDIHRGELGEIAKKFNTVVLLDQNSDEYQNIDDYWLTVELVNNLKAEVEVIFLDQDQNFTTFDALKKSPSLCVMPFISYRREGKKVSPCCYYDPSVDFATYDDSFKFSSNPEFQALREQMTSGSVAPGCNYCSLVEQQGAMSPRISNSVEWFVKLGINTLDKLVPAISSYDLRLGNQCNLKCRTCIPKYSNLIDREYYEINIVNERLGDLQYDDFTNINLETVRHVYVAGGEPTINNGLIEFLKTCVEQKKTDFELVINTNAASLPEKFVGLIDKFQKIKFEISVDGFGLVNQYIRWPVKWEKLVRNIETLNLASQGRISFNTVASIYNMGNFYNCLNFLDSKYPHAEKHIAYAFDPAGLQPWNFPDKKVALGDLEKVHELACFKNQAAFKSKILGLESLIRNHDVTDTDVVDFFAWNDLLDANRGVNLGDFIPQLEKCRISQRETS